MSDRATAQLLAENKRLRAEVERLDRIVNPPPPEPSEEPASKPRLYVLALSDFEKRIVPNAFQMPEAIKSVALDRFNAIDIVVQPGQAWFKAGDLVFRQDQVETFRIWAVPRPETFRQTCLKARHSYVGVQQAAAAGFTS